MAENNFTYLIQVTPDDRENYETYVVRANPSDIKRESMKEEAEIDDKIELLKVNMAYMFREFQMLRCNKLAFGKKMDEDEKAEHAVNQQNIHYLENWIHALANAYNCLAEWTMWEDYLR